MSGSFPCVKCGACCMVMGKIPGMAEYDRGDGGCIHLTTGNLCAIYEQRPFVCRVDEGCPPVMEPAEWRRRNEDACARLHLQVYGQPLPIGGT